MGKRYRTMRRGDRDREHVILTLGLTDDELDELVARAGADSVLELTRILEKFIIRNRIPVVIRRTGDKWLGGRSLLEVLRSEGIDSIKKYLDRLFSFIPE
ncbi:MAG: hypothetical protein ABSE64_07995 [Vulcanimicrobiaceae bacterium]|jgi:hypothetical protein